MAILSWFHEEGEIGLVLEEYDWMNSVLKLESVASRETEKKLSSHFDKKNVSGHTLIDNGCRRHAANTFQKERHPNAQGKT